MSSLPQTHDLSFIIEDWLEAHGYDGLVNVDYDCACLIEQELMPCGEPRRECEAGHKIPCETGEYDWSIEAGPREGEPTGGSKA